ncbi:MAG: Gfo/Idh/MocA family oxidoreductase [Planctomycetes bacterium]|nr:Gfo/Idh/MocA family oxidoreductase [Planctomycetota bacterium]
MAKVKIAFLGCGGFMGIHAGRLKGHPDAQIVALCDTTAELVQTFYGKHLADYQPKPAFFTDAAAMYAQAKPDAVFIATPHTLHFQHGMQALDAGLHVYMEKPMVTAAADAYAMAAKAKEKKRICVVGYNTSSSPEFEFIRNAIRTQEFGKLEMVFGYLAQDWKRLTTGMWRQKPELSGGGQAYDSGAHLLNSLVWSVESNIAEVFAFVDNQETPVDINTAMTVRFTNGVLASMLIGGNCATGGTYMSFLFDNGKIEVDGWGANWMKVWKGGKEIKYPAVTGKEQTPDDNFIDAVLGRAEPRTSPANGIVQSELMDAIYESARTGRPAKPKQRP